jgi:hypothetical protein
MNLRSRRVLGIVGASLVVWALWIRPRAGMTVADEVRAFQRLASAELTDTRGGSTDLTFTAPNDPAWSRITGRWGDPGYLVAVSSPGKQLRCFNEAITAISAVEGGGRSLPLVRAGEPLYGYSGQCRDEGVTIRPKAGAQVRVHADLDRARLGTGAELIILPYWTESVKDRMVGSQLDSYIRRATEFLVSVGVLLVGWAFWPRRRR